MKAIYYSRFGGPDVLTWGELPDPRPDRGEVLVRVHAAAINPKDILLRKGKFALMAGKKFPKVPGYDVAGVVEAAGPGVTSLASGDEVFGMIQAWSAGANAELVAVPANNVAPKPPNLSMTDAAAVPLVSLTALQALKGLVALRSGESVAINGASGGVGTHAIQISKILGGRVTAICSRRNEELVRSVGADDVAAYDETPLVSLDQRFDVLFDLFGNAPYSKVRHLLAKGGRYVTAIPGPGAIAREYLARCRLSRARLIIVRSDRRDLEQVTEWLVAGQLRPVVDRVMPMAEAADAHRYLESKRARGKVVLTAPACE